MFGIGYMELLIIGLIVVLLFGHRLPGLMRDLGRGITEFKHGLHDTDDHTHDVT
jgi:sec-independent protein translocase protein TatA